MNKVALVTGASSGIGKETAKLLVQNGYTVYGAARRIEKMADLKDSGENQVCHRRWSENYIISEKNSFGQNV